VGGAIALARSFAICTCPFAITKGHLDRMDGLLSSIPSWLDDTQLPTHHGDPLFGVVPSVPIHDSTLQRVAGREEIRSMLACMVYGHWVAVHQRSAKSYDSRGSYDGDGVDGRKGGTGHNGTIKLHGR
jgi:hypothetical protein